MPVHFACSNRFFGEEKCFMMSKDTFKFYELLNIFNLR